MGLLSACVSHLASLEAPLEALPHTRLGVLADIIRMGSYAPRL